MKITAKLYLLFLTLATLSTIGLNFNLTPDVFLPPTNPQLLFEHKIREYFPDDDNLSGLFELEPRFEQLQQLNQLMNEFENMENSNEVMSAFGMDHVEGDESSFNVSPLLDLEIHRDLKAVDQRLQSDPFASPLVVSQDRRFWGFSIEPKNVKNIFDREAMVEKAKALINASPLKDQFRGFVGPIAINTQEWKSVLADNSVFVPITVIIGFLLIGLIYQRWTAIIVAFTAVNAGMMAAFWPLVLMDQPFNSITGLVPPMVSALSIALCIHLFNALVEGNKRFGPGRDAYEHAIKEVYRPSLFTVITTVAGLISLTLSPIPPIKYFGIAASSGLFSSFMMVFFVVMPWLKHRDKKPWAARKSIDHAIQKLVLCCARISMKFPIQIIAVAVVIFGYSAYKIPQVKVESNLLKFFRDSDPINVSTRIFQKNLVGTSPVEVIFTANDSGYFQSPEALQYLADIKSWMLDMPEVDYVMGPQDVVKEFHWAFNNEDPEKRKIPESKALTAQYLFIYDGEDLYDSVDEDFKIARLSISMNVHGAKEIGDVLQRFKDHIGTSKPKDLSFEVIGFGRLFSDQERLLVTGQINSLLGAIIIMFFCMLFFWRSPKQSLISMVPNLAPVAVVFTFMSVFDIWLDFATALISSHIIGVAIDDTIHIYFGIHSKMKRGFSVPSAVFRTLKSSGRAVTATTVILVVQFLCLTGSNYIPTTEFGLLSAVGLSSALIFDLLLLPALIFVICRKDQNTHAKFSA